MINGKRCQSCNAEGCATPNAGFTGDQHARQDALAKHQPGTALTAAARRKSLGGGTGLMDASIGKARVAGAADYTPGSDEHGLRFYRGSGGGARGCGFEERVGAHARSGGSIASTV